MTIEITETQLVRQCLNYLLIRGHYVWRNNTGATRLSYTKKNGDVRNRILRAGVPGSSDIIGVSLTGRFIAIECKVGKNKTTELQNMFLQRIDEHGGIAMVVYDVDELLKYGL